MEKNRRLVSLLVILVVILAIILIYALVIKPSVNGFTTKLSNDGLTQGVNLAKQNIIQQLQQTGQVQIPYGNQTLVLITPQECSQYLQATQPAVTSVNNSINSTG